MARLLTRRAPALGLLALAAADVVLITFALKAGAGPEAADPAAGAAISSSSSAAAKGPTPSPGHSGASGQGTASAPRSSPTPGPGSARLMIEAVDGKHAWRVFAGTCDKGGATIERTSDGGATWEHVTSPLRTLTRLQPRSPEAAFVVGADRSCKPQLRSTVDKGGSWAATAPASLAWYIDPRNPRVVHAPGAGPTRPCPGQGAAIDLAASGVGGAAVLCGDGRVMKTASGGSSWSGAGRVKGAVALAVSPAGAGHNYVIRRGGPGCAGLQLVRASVPARILSCAVGDAPADAPASLSLTTKGAWLAVGNEVLHSPDLRSWLTTPHSS
jgi:hypothetical protein